MRRRIALLVAAVTSAVVLAFVIPLGLLVRTMAADRALRTGDDEARYAAIVVGGFHGDPQLADTLRQADARTPAVTSVLAPDGSVLGAAAPDLAADEDVRTARDQRRAFTDIDPGGGAVLIPVLTEDGTYVVRTTVTTEQMRRGVYRAWVSIGLLGALLLGLAVLIAVRIGRRVSTPVTDLARVAERLQQGELDARAALQGPPETVELAETINRLADRIVELLAAERAAVGDLSHRLRTPVTALRLDAESVAEPDLADRLQEHIEQLQRTVDAIVRDARRPLHGNLASSCDATAVVEERAAFWSALAEDQGRPVTVDLPDHPVTVALESTDLTDLIDVLVDNVFAHTADDVAFSIRLLETAEGAVLEVADTGTGIVADADRQPGEPRPGTTGLGLQIVRRTAARVGGHLSLTDGRPGLVARIVLPHADSGSRA